MIDSAEFRTAMSRLGAAVNIITTDGPGGRHGMTASAVCSVSDEPACLLVCINRASQMNAVIARNGKVCVNVLAGAQQELSGIFADRRKTTDERFGSAQWTVLRSGLPALEGALCSFDCRVVSVSEVGTHSVFFCQVEELSVSDGGDALMYFGRSYHRIALGTAA